jgi:hypothetical protein
MGEPKYYESMYEYAMEHERDYRIEYDPQYIEPETDTNLNTCEGSGLMLPIGDDYFAEEILPWYFNDTGNTPEEIPEENLIEHDGKIYEFFVTVENDGVLTPCYLCRYVSTGSFLRVGTNDVYWLLHKRVSDDDEYKCIGVYATYEEAEKVAEKRD